MSAGSQKTSYDQFFKKAKKATGPTSSARDQISFSSSSGSNIRDRLIAQERPQSASATATATVPRVELAEQLRRKLQQNKKKPKPARPSQSGLIFLLVLGCGGVGTGVWKFDEMMKWLDKVEIYAFGSANAEEPAAKTESPPSKTSATEKTTDKEKPNENKEVASASDGKKTTPEELDHFAKLRERKDELDQRDKKLGEAEAELTKKQAEVDKKLADLDEMRKKISKTLESRVQNDDKKVDALVQVYSTMKPQQAAMILESMDESLAVDILGRMKKKSSAEILNVMKPEKAKNFTEDFAGYRKPAST